MARAVLGAGLKENIMKTKQETAKHLNLNIETIRHLERDELDNVVGGGDCPASYSVLAACNCQCKSAVVCPTK